MATVKAGDRFTFRRAFDSKRYGAGGVVTSVTNVYPSRAHPGPAFVVWVKGRTDNGTVIEWQLGAYNKETKPAPHGRPMNPVPHGV